MDFLKESNVPESEWDQYMEEVTGGRISDANALSQRWDQLSTEKRQELQEMKAAQKAAEERNDTDLAEALDFEIKQLEAEQGEDMLERLRVKQVRRKGGKMAEIIYRFRKGFSDLPIIGERSKSARDVIEGSAAEIKPNPNKERQEREIEHAEKYGRDLF